MIHFCGDLLIFWIVLIKLIFVQYTEDAIVLTHHGMESKH